jgi:N-terminal domain of anti-restriction factor ArdC
MSNTERQDVYSRITSQIISSLEQGVRPWIQPWNAEYAAGRITRPLRHNGKAYSGINILMLWASAAAQGFTAPVWMTFKQAIEAGAHVRKGEKGSLVVYANIITKIETDAEANEVEREIPFMKGYTVFNVEQIEGLPEVYYTRPGLKFSPVERRRTASSPTPEPRFAMAGREHTTRWNPIASRCLPSKRSVTSRASTPPSVMKPPTGRSIRPTWTVTLAERNGATRGMPARNS